MRYILCIDQGTTSTKAFLLDEQGHLSDGAHVPFEQIYPNPGWVEHDAEEIYQSVLKAIAMLIAENPDAKGNIVAQDSIKTQAYHTAEAFVEAGVERLQPLIAQVGGIEQVAGMGIGAPNANYYSGAIETAPNIAWAHERVVPLARMFSENIWASGTTVSCAQAILGAVSMAPL